MRTVYLEDLTIGMAAEAERMVEERDVAAFAEVSGDRNPVHLDADYAATTPFKERIAHGMLSASFISALIAGELPGAGSVYLSQTLAFKRPVKLGAKVLTRVSVASIDAEKARVTLDCVCSVDGKPVIEGQALILAPRRSA